MGLDVADLIGTYTGDIECIANDPSLPGHRRRRHARSMSTIVVGGDRANHRMDLITIGQSVTEPLQSNYRCTRTEHCSAGLNVERTTMPIGAKWHVGLEIVRD